MMQEDRLLITMRHECLSLVSEGYFPECGCMRVKRGVAIRFMHLRNDNVMTVIYPCTENAVNVIKNGRLVKKIF